MTTPSPAPDARDLGETTSLEILRPRIQLAGRFVLDVGCGAMAFSRQLAEAGASVLAIDPDPVQAAANRAAVIAAAAIAASTSSRAAASSANTSADGCTKRAQIVV